MSDNSNESKSKPEVAAARLKASIEQVSTLPKTRKIVMETADK